MGNTKIEWTNKTWNPLTGCTKVSPGCDHCYAKTMHERFNGKGSFDSITLHPERLNQPLKWRKSARVFVNSMSDLFHRDVPDEYIEQVFRIMSVADQHTFQVLTKRPGRARSLLSNPRFCERVNAGVKWPLRNVWGGVSVEDQKWADVRIPVLLATPFAVRFLSCEPLLGPVDLYLNQARKPDWVICGGESGPGARPMHPDWARSLRDQCVAAGVPFLFKQWGEWAPGLHNIDRAVGIDRRGSALSNFNLDESQGHTFVTRVGKKAAGRELDGVTWDQFPAVVHA
jgi:protein gp37